MKTKNSKVSIFIFFIFITFAQAENQVSKWVNIDIPVGTTF